MKLRLAATILAVPLLAACTTERPTGPEFTDIAGEILTFAENDARTSQPGRVNDGPLYVSVRSFHAAAERATGGDVPLEGIERALGEPIPAELEQILLCDTTGSLGGCWVRQYGVFVNLNRVQLSGNRMTLFVRTSTTDRRRHPTDFCHRVWRLEYRKDEAGWRQTERTLQRDCA
jgi:hypothetical protein